MKNILIAITILLSSIGVTEACVTYNLSNNTYTVDNLGSVQKEKKKENRFGNVKCKSKKHKK